MSVTIATLPRTGNGRTLFIGAAALLNSLFASKKKQAGLKAAAKSAKELSFWQLYRLTVGYDSISPKVAAELRKQLVD